VRGLERVPEAVVVDSIGVRPGELLSEERLRADVAAVVATGWFADATVRTEPLRDGLRVVFLVVENPAVTRITVEGHTKLTNDEVLRTLNIPLGQVLNNVRLRDGARAIEKLYEEKGFVLARIADVGITADNGGAHLRMRIAEGKVEAIQYKGLVRTQRFVLERVTTMRAGAVFNINELNKDLQQLVALELFETVQARPVPAATPDVVVVEIEVKEQRTRQARFALGYSDRIGIAGLLEYSERNWKGRNQQITVRLERGLTGDRQLPTSGAPSSFSVSFREPFLDRHRTVLDLTLYQTNANDSEYLNGILAANFTLNRLGSAISLTRPIDPQTTVTLRLRSERAGITALPLSLTTPPCNIDPSDPLCPRPLPSQFSPGRSIVLSMSGVRDRRDNPRNATRGERWAVGLDFGLPVLGANFGFGKYVAEYSRYIPAGSGVIVGRALLGWSHGNLPLQEQFVLGGPTTLRAYPAGFLRGASASLLNVEYRTPLGGIARQLRDFTGIAYVDAGAAPISTSFQLGYGVGVMVNTSFGAIRVDYAVRPGGNQTWLTIGNPF
jgi:outer membrane protein insertion porin family